MDVARAASVSRQTVSNAVNSPHKVAPETLDRVLSEIHRLGFRPSRAARTLKQQRAGAWGLELNVGDRGRLGSVLDAFLVELTAISAAHDTFILPFTAVDPLAPIKAYEEALASRLADGFVLTDTRHDDPRPGWLTSQGIPFATFGRVWDDSTRTNWVDVDGGAGVAAAVHHLASQGYERIGFLGWPPGSPVGDDRRQGWARATAELGLADETRQAVSLQGHEAAAEAAGPLLEALGVGGAIVCASDVLAVGVWRRLVEAGLQLGRDVGLVGFDDTESAAALGLTTVRQPLAQVAGHVLAMLERDTPPLEGVVLSPELVLRGSSSRSGRAPVTAPRSSIPATSAAGGASRGRPHHYRGEKV